MRRRAIDPTEQVYGQVPPALTRVECQTRPAPQTGCPATYDLFLVSPYANRR